jgi:hypothetical protein
LAQDLAQQPLSDSLVPLIDPELSAALQRG